MLNFVRMMFAVVCLSINIVAHSEEICIVGREDVISRIENRSFPSIFSAWSNRVINYNDPESIVTHNDLSIYGIFRGTQWRLSDTGSQLVSIGGNDYNVHIKNQVTDQNPNFIYISTLDYYGAKPEVYPDDWKYWLRNKDGNRIRNGAWPEYLIDWTSPGAIDHFVQRALAIANCGLHDGIFLDWWDESPEWDQEWADLYHSSKVDALVLLVKRIREAVGDNFLIIVNTNTRKIPRSAPYINGAYMEAIGTVDGYTRERLIEIEDALTWYESNLRYPQVNSLEGRAIPKEPMNSHRNIQQFRAVLALGLTHSDGYISYVTGIVSPSHNHHYEIWEGHSEEHKLGIPHDHTHQRYWYDLYNVNLGKPVGAKSQTYNGIDGLFIREFAHGWVVYNRSGSEQSIRFGSHVSGKSSGFGGTEHIIPDLDGEIYLKTKPIDVNADGVINVLDLVIVANAMGDTNGPADVNGDGIVNILDLVLISNGF